MSKENDMDKIVEQIKKVLAAHICVSDDMDIAEISADDFDHVAQEIADLIGKKKGY